MFGFDPVDYEFRKGSERNLVNVSLLSGDLGELTVLLTAVTDGDSMNGTTTGELTSITRAVQCSDFLNVVGLEYTLEVQLNSTSTSGSFSPTVFPDEQREFFELILTNITVKKNGAHTLLSDQERSRIQITVDRARIIISNESGKHYTPPLPFSKSIFFPPPLFFICILHTSDFGVEKHSLCYNLYIHSSHHHKWSRYSDRHNQ